MKIATAASLRIQITEANAEVEHTAQAAGKAKADYKRVRKVFKRAKKAAKQARKCLKALVGELEKLPAMPAKKRAKRMPARIVEPAPSTPIVPSTATPLGIKPDSSGRVATVR